MDIFLHDRKFIFTKFLILCMIVVVSCRAPVYKPPEIENLTDHFSRLSVNQSYNVFYGGSNVHMINNGSSAEIILDKSSGTLQQFHTIFYFFLAKLITLNFLSFHRCWTDI